MVCNGLGLFIACSDDVDSVTIPSSTPICGYSRGIFTEYNIIDSDKTVLYRFTNINQGVLFEKKVMRLIDVIRIMMDRYTIDALDRVDSMLLGHIITVKTVTYSKDDDNSDDDNGLIVPDESYKNNYFIPDHYINNNIEDNNNSSSNDDNRDDNFDDEDNKSGDNGSSNDDNNDYMTYNDTDTASDIIQTIVDDKRDDDSNNDDDDNDDDDSDDAGNDSVVVKTFDINATNIGKHGCYHLKLFFYNIMYMIIDTYIHILHSCTSVGIFANDLAYEAEEMSSLSQEIYDKNAKTKNILELLWRLEDKNGCIIPTWPVVMITKDVLIRNRNSATEVGLTYSYRYWKSMHQQQQQISNNNNESSS